MFTVPDHGNFTSICCPDGQNDASILVNLRFSPERGVYARLRRFSVATRTNAECFKPFYAGVVEAASTRVNAALQQRGGIAIEWREMRAKRPVKDDLGLIVAPRADFWGGKAY